MAVRKVDPTTGQEYSLFSVSCEVMRSNLVSGESVLDYVVIGKGLFVFSEERRVFIKSFSDPDAAMDLVEELEASIISSEGIRNEEKL